MLSSPTSEGFWSLTKKFMQALNYVVLTLVITAELSRGRWGETFIFSTS